MSTLGNSPPRNSRSWVAYRNLTVTEHRQEAPIALAALEITWFYLTCIQRYDPAQRGPEAVSRNHGVLPR